MRNPQTQDTIAASSGQAAKTRGALVGGRYQMERLLGAGAMGEVWEARHVLLDRVVAIKLLGSQLRLVADRLVIEAQALARVRHPAIVEVYDCGTLEDGTPYIAMERLRGETLANAIGRGPLPVATAVRLFIPLLDGLAAAHRAGVIHRDIKPENIFLADDASSGMTPKLIDFGIARIENGGPRATLDGSLIGTPAYMSPEQFRGERSGEPADFWSAAASLYEVITGKPPFGDDQIATIMHRVIEAPLPYPRKVAGFDGRLWSFLARGLRKLPDQRFPSAEAMRDELIAWLAKAPPAPTDARAAAPVAPAAAKATQPYRPSAPGVASTPPTPEPQATLDHTIRQKLR